MQKAIRIVDLGIMFVLFSSLSFFSAQDPLRDDEEPTTLDKYDLVARGKMSQDRGGRPVQIARMDNNGEILFACIEAKTIEQLKSAGLKFRQSQLELLVEGNQFFFVSAATMPKLDLRQVMAFVKDVATDNKVDDPELIKSLSAFSLCDEEGKLTIPIIEKEWSTKLENMAKKVYTKTIELVDSEEMKDILDMETQAQAAMFLHYEIRYAFLDHLLEKRIIEAPVDFKNADNNSPADARNLVFMMKTEKQD